MCQCLKTVEEEDHIVSGQCEVYGDLRSQFGDLQQDKNLVQYFQAVLDRKDILEEVDRMQQSSTAAVGASLISGDRERTSHPGSKTPGMISFDIYIFFEELLLALFLLNMFPQKSAKQ